jgi:hypothetical protein
VTLHTALSGVSADFLDKAPEDDNDGNYGQGAMTMDGRGGAELGDRDGFDGNLMDSINIGGWRPPWP